MQQKISLQLLPSEAADETIVKKLIANTSGKKESSVSGFHIIKKSIDARAKTIWTNLTVNAFIDEPFYKRDIKHTQYKDVSKVEKTVVIIGAGPAGLFAAFKCIELGIKPIILERGKEIRARRRDLALLNKEGIVNPESNYCFAKVAQVPTAMANYILAAINGAISTIYSTSLFSLGQMKRFYTKPIPILEPISYPTSFPQCALK